MENYISDYSLKTHKINIINSSTKAKNHLISNLNINKSDVIYLFISDINDSKDTDGSIIWMFTQNNIIKSKYSDNDKEYNIIPINTISNVPLKFSNDNIILGFDYIMENYSLNAHSEFNKTTLLYIHNFIINNGI